MQGEEVTDTELTPRRSLLAYVWSDNISLPTCGVIIGETGFTEGCIQYIV